VFVVVSYLQHTLTSACPLLLHSINDGCPVAGATVMECTEGYKGPMCAMCNEGYYTRLRECITCEGFKSSQFVTALFVFFALLFFAVRFAMAHSRYIDAMARSSIFSHIKIFVSFVTVMSTVDTQ
jgi:hypothetical protein